MKAAAVRHSAIYRGQIRHRRFGATQNAFTYPIALLYIDLDELPIIFRDVPFWSADRVAWGQFREQDYLAEIAGENLRQRVDRVVLDATGEKPDGPVRVLAHPRYAGVAMNPISCFFCFDCDGTSLRYLVAEVTNTPWGERKAYVLPCKANVKQQQVAFAKAMHVSPFNPMAMLYHARFNTPHKKLYLHLENRHLENIEIENRNLQIQGATACVTDATLTLQRQPCTRGNLLRLLWQFPLQTAQVAVGIYWQALKLACRGARFHAHPGSRSAVDHPVTLSKEIHP